MLVLLKSLIFDTFVSCQVIGKNFLSELKNSSFLEILVKKNILSNNNFFYTLRNVFKIGIIF